MSIEGIKLLPRASPSLGADNLKRQSTLEIAGTCQQFYSLDIREIRGYK
jgi:hypothetical protein